jgi:hypothetical protein
MIMAAMLAICLVICLPLVNQPLLKSHHRISQPSCT